MAQAFPSDHPIVQATARLLSDDPDLTNAHILRKLPGLVGAAAVQEVPVTHFQRRVRQPAERLLRQRVMNVSTGAERFNGNTRSSRFSGSSKGGRAASEAAPSPYRDDGPSAGRAPSESDGRPGSPALSERHREAVDEALAVAFELGAGSDSSTDVVEAYRRLDRVRRDLRAFLDGSRRRKPSFR